MSTTRYSEAKKVTVAGGIKNAFLGLGKIIGGLLFHSHALIADGLHSLADLITDTMVVVASKYGSQGADDEHPYGHQRFETAATLLLALLLVLTGFGICWDALYELGDKSWSKPALAAIPIAIFSIFANELLFHYTRFIGKKIRSTLILTNAWHHRTDAYSSMVVLIGLLGNRLGFEYCDTLAAIIVGAMIIKMGLSYGHTCIKELVDTAVEPEILLDIMKIIASFEGVLKIHQLRTRLMGGDILIDVHILVSPKLSVSEGHFIAQQVHYALIDHCDRVLDVIVHVDPEDDEVTCPSLHLPERKVLQRDLFLPWKEAFPELDDWVLHYLDGCLQIDLLVTTMSQTQLKALEARIRKDLCDFSEIASVQILSKNAFIQKAEPAF